MTTFGRTPSVSDRANLLAQLFTLFRVNDTMCDYSYFLTLLVATDLTLAICSPSSASALDKLHSAQQDMRLRRTTLVDRLDQARVRIADRFITSDRHTRLHRGQGCIQGGSQVVWQVFKLQSAVLGLQHADCIRYLQYHEFYERCLAALLPLLQPPPLN